MCVTCGCSDGSQTTYTLPGQKEDLHPSHTHVLEDGTVITHTHEPPPNHGQAEHHTHGHPAIKHHEDSSPQPQLPPLMPKPTAPL